MRRWPVAFVAGGVSLVGPACSSDPGSTECQCGPTGVTVDIPSDRAADTTGLTLSGRGCATATPKCVQTAGDGCAEYTFDGTGIGSCTIDVQFAAQAGDFSETVAFAQFPCCPGFYVQPDSAATIEVPEAPSP